MGFRKGEYVSRNILLSLGLLVNQSQTRAHLLWDGSHDPADHRGEPAEVWCCVDQVWHGGEEPLGTHGQMVTLPPCWSASFTMNFYPIMFLLLLLLLVRMNPSSNTGGFMRTVSVISLKDPLKTRWNTGQYSHTSIQHRTSHSSLYYSINCWNTSYRIRKRTWTYSRSCSLPRLEFLSKGLFLSSICFITDCGDASGEQEIQIAQLEV